MTRRDVITRLGETAIAWPVSRPDTADAIATGLQGMK